MKCVRHSLIILIFISTLIFAQGTENIKKNVTNVATTAAPFLEIGVGARAIGMGGAFVATANDVSAMYWNPAGIGQLQSVEAIFVHTEWLAEITYDYAGIVFPLYGYGTLGLNITTLNMGEMLVRTVDRPEGTGEKFEASDLALGLSYGLSLTNRFSIGFNFKYISQKIWHESATGFAVDIGTLYKTPWRGFRIGAALANFGTDMQMTGDDLLVYHDIDPYQEGNNDKIFSQLQTDNWPLPLTFQLGLAYDIVKNENQLLTIEADAVHPIDNSESMHFGAEYRFMNKYYLRAGYRNLFLKDSEEGVTAGAGLVWKFMSNLQAGIDYAYANFGRLENAQRFAVILKF